MAIGQRMSIYLLAPPAIANSRPRSTFDGDARGSRLSVHRARRGCDNHLSGLLLAASHKSGVGTKPTTSALQRLRRLSRDELTGEGALSRLLVR